MAVQICLGSHQILVFRQEKVQIYRFLITGFSTFFKRIRVQGSYQQFFSRIWISISQVLIFSNGLIRFFGFHRIRLVFKGCSDWVFRFGYFEFFLGFGWFFSVRILSVFIGSDHSRASTIQRCKRFHASHSLFDRQGKTFDFRDE